MCQMGKKVKSVRLIDADALLEKIQLMIGVGVIYGAEAEAIERMLHEVEHAPTVSQPVGNSDQFDRMPGGGTHGR